MILFLISYAPLFLIYAMNTFSKLKFQKIKFGFLIPKCSVELLISIILIFLMILPTIFFIFYIKVQEKKGTDILVKADKLEMTQDTIISYLMTYVLPFVTDSSLNVQNIILFLIILVLAVRLDIVYINPTLILLKYNVFKNADKDKYYLLKLPTRRIAPFIVILCVLSNIKGTRPFHCYN